MKQSRADIAGKVFKILSLFLLSILTVGGFVKSVLVGLDVDESYAIAVAYRLAVGDKLLLDLWEPHQMSGIFLAPFVALYLHLCGDADGIVIYLRILGILLHSGVGLLFIRTFRKRLSRTSVFIFLLLSLNFLPKWVQIPEFELLHEWFLLLSFLCLYQAFRKKLRIYFVLAGFLNLCMVLVYPTLLLLYPVFLLGILRSPQYPPHRRLRSALPDLLLYTAGAVVPGCGFLLYLFRYQTIPELISHLKRLNSDLSHSIPLTHRLLAHAQMLLPILLLSAAIYAVLSAIAHRKKSDPLPWIRLGLYGSAILFSLAAFIGTLVFSSNQFFLLWRYFPVVLGGMILARSLITNPEPPEDLRNDARLFGDFGIFPGILSFLLILCVTNMDAGTTMAKMFPAVLEALLLALLSQNADPSGKQPLTRLLFLASCLSMLLPLLLCRLYLIRVTGCVPCTILEPMKRLSGGPQDGIWQITELAEPMNADYDFLAPMLDSEDALLYIGCENLIYLWSNARISTASTQGTNVFNQMFIDYLNEHPEKYPTTVVVDKELWEYPYYYNSEWNIILLNWIQDWFPYEEAIETDYLIVYRTAQ